MSLNRTVKIILTALLLAAGIGLGTNQYFYRVAIASSFFAFALANVIIIHLRLAWKWLDAGLIVAGAVTLTLIDIRFLHFRPAILAWLSFAGLSSLLIFGARTIWAKESNRKLFLLGFVPALLFVVSEYFADNLLRWTALHNAKDLDLYLFSFDSSLGVQIPVAVGQAFSRWPPLHLVALLFYMGLPIPISLIYAGRVLRDGKKAIGVAAAFLATGPVGVVFYNLFPALGPVHLFLKDFPWHTLTVSQASRLFTEPISIDGPPNAMPSLHMAWVLLVWWYSRGLSWWERAVAGVFLIFTVLATLGTGEHYVIDLVVAFPFALLMEAAFDLSLKITDRPRMLGVCIGLAGTLVWFSLLRHALHFFWLSPAIPWSFCIGTIAVSLFSERLLDQTKDLPGKEPAVVSPVLSVSS